MSLVKITQKLMEQEYSLGETDCFSTVYHYLQQTGADVPKEWNGLTISTYAGLYLKDPEGAKEIMTEFLNEHLTPVKISRAFAGDILLCNLRGHPQKFPAIHGGNGNIICVTEDRGVTLMPLRYYTVERAWRWQV